MQNLRLCLAALLVVFVPALCHAESKEDAAFKTVMEHLCEKGYQYAMAEYNVGVCVFDCPLQWSRRTLRTDVDATGFGKQDIPRIKLHLKRMTELRAGIDCYRRRNSLDADYHFLEAQAMLAKVDESYREQWSPQILDLAKLQGIWVEEREKRRGGDRSKESRTMEIAGSFNAGLGFITIDPTSEPKTIDFRAFFMDVFVTKYGIYEIKGDQLRIAIDERLSGTKENRPTSFMIDEDDGDLVVYTYKRQKPDSDNQPGSETTGNDP